MTSAPIALIRKPASQFEDLTASSGATRYYRLCAVDEIGQESTPACLSSCRLGWWRWTTLGARHLMYALAALVTFLVIGYLDYTKLARITGPLYRSPVLWMLAVAVLLCLAVLIPGVGTSINGARRWIRLGPLQIQPSELAKWAAVLFLAWWLANPPVDLSKFFGGFLPTLVPVAVLCLLVVIQDFGTAALIALCGLTMLLAGRVKLWHLLVILVPVLLAGVWFITHKQYRLRRIMAFRDPYASPQGEGYHMIQSLLSFYHRRPRRPRTRQRNPEARLSARRHHRFHLCRDLRRTGHLRRHAHHRCSTLACCTSPGRPFARNETTSAGFSPSGPPPCSGFRPLSISPSPP